MLERITYVSRATPGLRREDVFGIIRTAHPANSLAGVTGGLVFLDGWFAQVLEGEAGALALALATALSAGAYAPAVQAANAPAVSAMTRSSSSSV